MAQTPEQKVHSALKSLLASRLPKGRWILQRIETSTGIGIPDNYFSLLNWGSMWIETKTVDYVVSHEQLNWAATHWLASGLTYLVTRIKHTPTTRPRTPSVSSNVPAHSTAYPALLLLGCKRLQPYEQLVNTQRKDELIFLSFDDKMRECSTLGVYLRRFNPDVLLVSDWVTSMCVQS